MILILNIQPCKMVPETNQAFNKIAITIHKSQALIYKAHSQKTFKIYHIIARTAKLTI